MDGVYCSETLFLFHSNCERFSIHHHLDLTINPIWVFSYNENTKETSLSVSSLTSSYFILLRRPRHSRHWVAYHSKQPNQTNLSSFVGSPSQGFNSSNQSSVYFFFFNTRFLSSSLGKVIITNHPPTFLPLLSNIFPISVVVIRWLILPTALLINQPLSCCSIFTFLIFFVASSNILFGFFCYRDKRKKTETNIYGLKQSQLKKHRKRVVWYHGIDVLQYWLRFQFWTFSF